MSKRRCLYCYQPIDDAKGDFHPTCSRKMFGKTTPPILPYSEDQMLELAEKVIKSQVTVPGVQPKLSLEIDKLSSIDILQKFPSVGLWGSYILNLLPNHIRIYQSWKISPCIWPK